MRTEQNRRARRLGRAQPCTAQAMGQGIQTTHRLVENQELTAREQTGDQSELLRHALRIIPGPPLEGGGIELELSAFRNRGPFVIVNPVLQ